MKLTITVKLDREKKDPSKRDAHHVDALAAPTPPQLPPPVPEPIANWAKLYAGGWFTEYEDEEGFRPGQYL